MTDKEIIKALKDCSTYAYHYCNECGFKDGELLKAALNLINCKDSKIAELTEESNRQQAEIENLVKNNISTKYPYCVLSSNGAILTKTLEDYDKLINDIALEAIKEFAERLKESKFDVDVSFGYGREVYTEAVAVVEIDNLVKEMVGEG